MSKLIEKIKSLDKPTIVRAVIYILTIANQIVALIGMTTYADAVWYQITSAVVTIVMSAVMAWKNNNFTYLAQLAGSVLDALRDGTITEDEVKGLLDKADAEIKEGDTTNEIE